MTDPEPRCPDCGSRPQGYVPHPYCGVCHKRCDQDDVHRGWTISFDYPPIPVRDFDYSATHPDYDGAEDANDNRVVHGPTREAVKVAIDDWHAEQRS